MLLLGLDALRRPSGVKRITVTQQVLTRVDSITPSRGSFHGGEAVVIKGAGFAPSGNIVHLGNASCVDVRVVDAGTITCTIEATRGTWQTGVVTVSNARYAGF